MNDSKPTHVYIGRKSCGCCVAVTVDLQDKYTGKSVGEFISGGLMVERITFDDYRNFVCKESSFMECPHGKEQMVMELTAMKDGGDGQT
jgi:hypothetical protein